MQLVAGAISPPSPRTRSPSTHHACAALSASAAHTKRARASHCPAARVPECQPRAAAPQHEVLGVRWGPFPDSSSRASQERQGGDGRESTRDTLPRVPSTRRTQSTPPRWFTCAQTPGQGRRGRCPAHRPYLPVPERGRLGGRQQQPLGWDSLVLRLRLQLSRRTLAYYGRIQESQDQSESV